LLSRASARSSRRWTGRAAPPSQVGRACVYGWVGGCGWCLVWGWGCVRVCECACRCAATPLHCISAMPPSLAPPSISRKSMHLQGMRTSTRTGCCTSVGLWPPRMARRWVVKEGAAPGASESWACTGPHSVHTCSVHACSRMFHPHFVIAPDSSWLRRPWHERGGQRREFACTLHNRNPLLLYTMRRQNTG